MEVLLAELEPLLYGYNYQVFLRAYRVPLAPTEPAEWYIAKALGPSALIGGIVPVTGPELVAVVARSLQYSGDESSGPDQSALSSERFETLVGEVLAELERTLDGAKELAQFWLRDGHPGYPVFWDFAFVIVAPSGGLVLIGSSSD